MALRDTPDAFDKAFLAALFDRDESALRGFGVAPVGTGQVGGGHWSLNVRRRI